MADCAGGGGSRDEATDAADSHTEKLRLTNSKRDASPTPENPKAPQTLEANVHSRSDVHWFSVLTLDRQIFGVVFTDKTG